MKNYVLKKDICNAKIKDIEDKIRDITNLVTNASFNAKKYEVKNEAPSITNLATTTAFTAVENKIPDHSKYITTPEFNKVAAKNFASRLAQVNLASKTDIANLVKKTDFDDKLKILSKKFTSNKTKHILAENELNELQEKVKLLSTKDFDFLLGRMYFTRSDGFQYLFVYEPIFNVLELKRTSVLNILLVGNQKKYLILKLLHYMVLFYLT